MDFILDSGLLPHAVIRVGIRRQLAQRIHEIQTTSLSAAYERKMAFIDALRQRPIAVETATANRQHYEVRTGVLAGMLGPRMKYSSCLYPKGGETLAQAEVAMLQTYVDKAELKDGMSVLDLGCGWGSAALFFAQVLPNSKITALSNSRTQKEYISGQAQKRGLSNLTVITADVVDYVFEKGAFDRVVSIELFEHMKNYEQLMGKISRALKPGGKLFVQIFAHHATPYDFEAGWMTTHFFTGGTMPSADLLLYFQKDLKLQRQWWVKGIHYSKTCEHWLSNMLANRKQLWPHLMETYGEANASRWYNRWQIFYMACSELFAYDGGDTWGVSHYLFEKPEASPEMPRGQAWKAADHNSETVHGDENQKASKEAKPKASMEEKSKAPKQGKSESPKEEHKSKAEKAPQEMQVKKNIPGEHGEHAKLEARAEQVKPKASMEEKSKAPKQGKSESPKEEHKSKAEKAPQEMQVKKNVPGEHGEHAKLEARAEQIKPEAPEESRKGKQKLEAPEKELTPQGPQKPKAPAEEPRPGVLSEVTGNQKHKAPEEQQKLKGPAKEQKPGVSTDAQKPEGSEEKVIASAPQEAKKTKVPKEQTKAKKKSKAERQRARMRG